MLPWTIIELMSGFQEPEPLKTQTQKRENMPLRLSPAVNSIFETSAIAKSRSCREPHVFDTHLELYPELMERNRSHSPKRNHAGPCIY